MLNDRKNMIRRLASEEISKLRATKPLSQNKSIPEEFRNIRIIKAMQYHAKAI